jgi:uncharacterized OB-fold protein
MVLNALDVPNTGARPRFDRAVGLLVGSACDRCQATSWPARAVCHRCGHAPTTQAAFSASGTLLSFTTVWVSRPGVPAPFMLVQVKLDYGPVVVSHGRGLGPDLRTPAPVTLVLNDDPDAVPAFWFEAPKPSADS